MGLQMLTKGLTCTSLVRLGTAGGWVSYAISAPPHPDASRPIPTRGGSTPDHVHVRPYADILRWTWKQSIELNRKARDRQSWEQGYQAAWRHCSWKPDVRQQWSQTPIIELEDTGTQTNSNTTSSSSTDLGASAKAKSNASRASPY